MRGSSAGGMLGLCRRGRWARAGLHQASADHYGRREVVESFDGQPHPLLEKCKGHFVALSQNGYGRRRNDDGDGDGGGGDGDGGRPAVSGGGGGGSSSGGDL